MNTSFYHANSLYTRWVRIEFFVHPLFGWDSTPNYKEIFKNTPSHSEYFFSLIVWTHSSSFFTLVSSSKIRLNSIFRSESENWCIIPSERVYALMNLNLDLSMLENSSERSPVENHIFMFSFTWEGREGREGTWAPLKRMMIERTPESSFPPSITFGWSFFPFYYVTFTDN